MDEAVLHCTRGVGHLGLGEHRRRRRARRRAGLRRRRADAGDARRRRPAARAPARPQGPRGQRRRPDAPAAAERAPARACRDAEFDALFTTDKPVIFAYHGYPWLIHRLTYRRNGHDNIHVRGYKEEGTTTTPFDMVVLNDMDRFHLVIDVIDRVPVAPGPRPPSCARRWSTSACATAPTRARSATTCPTSATGRGRAAARSETPTEAVRGESA